MKKIVMSVFENISTPNLNKQGKTGDRLKPPATREQWLPGLAIRVARAWHIHLRALRRKLHDSLRASGFGRPLGLVAIDNELIADLGPAAENRIGRQFQPTPGTEIGPGNGEWMNQLPQSHYSEVLVDQNQIERKHHSNSVYCVCRNDPDTAVRLQRSSAEQANEPTQD